VPWQAAETMHWQLGQHDMARRAGVVPFTLEPTGDLIYQGGSARSHTHSRRTTPKHATPTPMSRPMILPEGRPGIGGAPGASDRGSTETATGFSTWDEQLKNKLAFVYQSVKLEMWARIAKEMNIPWKAVEAMHWIVGECEMERRASLTQCTISASAEPSPALPLPQVHLPSLTPLPPSPLPPPYHSIHHLHSATTPSSLPTTLPSLAELIAGADPYHTHTSGSDKNTD
jgi:hypothetical protein